MKYMFLFPLIFCLLNGLNTALRDHDGQAGNMARTLLISEASFFFFFFLPYLVYILGVTLLTDSKNKDFDYLRQASILNYTLIPVCIGTLLLLGGQALTLPVHLQNFLHFSQYLFWGWTFVLAIIAHSSLNKSSIYRSAIILAAPVFIVGFIFFSVGNRIPRLF